MDILEIIRKNRSYRRFDHSCKIKTEELESMIDAARYSPSMKNLQPLKYIICNDENMCGEIFGTLAWAGYMPEWDGPEPDERPSAYIVMLLDKSISNACCPDNGICAQSILLQATGLGYGGCIIGAINKSKLAKILGIESGMFEPVNVIALGKPVETVVVEDMNGGDCKYWRSEDKVHHVPKRTREELILKKY